MRLRILGPDGPAVSEIGLGCNNFGTPGAATEDAAATAAVLSAAVDAGVTLLDTADIYGGAPGRSEELIGAWLPGHRDEVVLATKWGHQHVDLGIAGGAPKGSREYIRMAVADSLRRLRTDVIDLYQMHTPDPLTPIEETAAALDELVAEGKIRRYGHTQFPAELMRAAAASGAWVSAQDEYSLLRREVESDRLPVARELGIGFLPFFPLASGLLTGKYVGGEVPAGTRLARRPALADAAPWGVLDEYAAFCAARGVTMLEASIGWLLAQPGLTSVIAGATSPEQIRANAAASDWRPTDEDVAAISAIFG